MADVEIVPLTQSASRKQIIDGINRIFGVLGGNVPGHFSLIGSDGVSRDIRGGATLATGKYTLKVISAAGLHFHVRNSGDTFDVLNVTDAKITTATPEVSFIGAGVRLTGDFSGATLALRGMFQSTTGAETTVGALPPAGGTTAGWVSYNNSTPASATVEATMRATSTAMELRAASPAGSYKPMDFYTNATKSVSITTAGRLDALLGMALTGSLSANGGIGTSAQVLYGGATPAWGAASVARDTAKVTNSAAQAITTGTFTILTFDTETWDTASMHSTSSNTSRITVPRAGKWRATAVVGWATDGSGNRISYFKINGTTRHIGYLGPGIAVNDLYYSYSNEFDLAANDYVEVEVLHNSVTSPLNVQAAGTTFMLTEIG